MLIIPGRAGRTCEGPTRRELLRIGSLGMAGLNLPSFFLGRRLRWRTASPKVRRRARLRQRQVRHLHLPAGRAQPHRHLGPEARRARQHSRRVQADQDEDSGHAHQRDMPMMAQTLDKVTLIRSMSYTPNGLFNHTAAIYQMLTGYPPDKVSPSGQLEPPNARRLPDRRQPRHQAEAAEGAGAAVRRTAAAAAGVGHHRQGRRRRIPRQGLRSVSAVSGSGEKVTLDDLSLRKEIPPERLKDRFELLKGINGRCRISRRR